jgi:hypothetical protein
MTVPILYETPRTLLEAAYEQLEFKTDALVPASKRADQGREEEWLERGDWQALAKDVGAEKIFFVDREPVAVFAELKSSDADVLRKFYNQVWCMARPQFLFLARPGELAVCDLGKPPLNASEKLEDQGRVLARAQTLAEVQEKLANYHRERLETGAVFGEEHFGRGLSRADRALIRDLKEVRRALASLKFREGTNLSQPRKTEILHSLIGRAIFIRYLEDREIITREYFEKVIDLDGQDASLKKEWRKLLDQPLPRPELNAVAQNLCFPRVLASKEFTYALFDQLAHDFNGDTFPVEPDEHRCLLQHHLTKLRDFLLGVAAGGQDLFFYAYNFKFIPIELISSIYEEFYNERVGDDQNQGSHYTPPALVEFVLANTLKPEVLAKKPRVLDPACGSAIFLVEAFRRMVRHLCATSGKERPTREELRTILRDQIAGMDINEEAVRVAAFSLYLAFLHYQKPREILPDPRENLRDAPEHHRKIRLPHLKCISAAEKKQRRQAKPGVEFFDTLLVASAFDPVMEKCEAEANKRFGSGCADVIVGNPPWGDPKPKTDDEKRAVADLKTWCDPDSGRPVGDNERSQAFIHLALSLLKDGGRAGLLVSSGVFFKHHDNSKAFRQVWLNAVQLRHVVNFAHVRHVFFFDAERKTKGISPFVSVVFDKVPLSAGPDNRFEYWSAKRTALVDRVKAVVMTHGDMHFLNQHECLANEKLWKIYWWGGHRDEILIQRLASFPKLSDLPNTIPGFRMLSGFGFVEGKQGLKGSGWLRRFQELPADALTRYGRLDPRTLRAVPDSVRRTGKREVYEGTRLLLGRGISQRGTIVARLEEKPCCFRHSILGVKLDGLVPWQEKALLAFFWSSLAQFYFFMTTGSWGMWHDEIYQKAVEGIPITLPGPGRIRDSIVRVVEELQHLELKPDLELARLGAQRRLPELEGELDEAIFDLYELDPAERDLVRDMCATGLDLFYRDHESDAVKEVIRPQRGFGTLADVSASETDLAGYLRVFLEGWNPQLAPDGEFAWRILSPASKAPLLAVVFETRSSDEATAPFDTSDQQAWRDVLEKLAEHAHVPAGSSRIFTDTFFRVVTEHEILIVKRNERRFWTKTAAREDFDATMLKAITAQEKQRRK